MQIVNDSSEVNVGDEIAWRVELSIKPDQAGNLLALTDEMVESASLEEGCLSYKRFIGPDGESIHLYERYLNSAAAQAHLALFSNRFSARFASMVDRKSVIVYGTPSNELRRVLLQFNPEYFRPFGNLQYWA